MPRLDAIGIVCSDLEASIRFYRVLGVPFPENADGEDHIEAAAGGIRLMLDHVDMVKEHAHDWVEPIGQRIGLAFLCDSPAEVDATYDRLIKAGYERKSEPWDAFWGQRYAQVYDPDKNAVDLFATL